jgi:hypothetical protein
LLLCYLVKLSRWCGVLEVTSEAFEDHSPIFADTEDPFTIRFHVKPRTLLDFEKAIPIEQPELWDHPSFTRDIEGRLVRLGPASEDAAVSCPTW